MDYIEKVSYRVDKKNVIIEVFDDWVTAAQVGQANTLADTKNVLGTPLFSYFLGDTTRMYYDVIFQKCRLLKKDHTIEYRCDSPTHKRFMEMQIVPFAEGNLDIYNYLLKEEPFPNPIYVYEYLKPNIKNRIVRCSICNHLKLTPDSEWVAPEHLVQDGEQTLMVIHSVCPSCKNKNR